MKQCPMSRSVTQNDTLDLKMSRKCHACHRMDIVQNRAPRLRFVRDFFQNKGHSQERTQSWYRICVLSVQNTHGCWLCQDPPTQKTCTISIRTLRGRAPAKVTPSLCNDLAHNASTTTTGFGFSQLAKRAQCYQENAPTRTMCRKMLQSRARPAR